MTTRKKRPGETEGIDYRFIDTTDFNLMVNRRELLEFAKVFGNYYGTPRAPVEDAWLRGKDGSGFGGVLVSMSATPRGGIAWFTRNRLPVLHGRGAARGAAVILANWGVDTRTTAVTQGRWVRMGGDSLWVEPFDAPGAPDGLLAYVPSLRWAYHALSVDPLVKELIMERAKQRGWTVERLGNARSLTAPVTPPQRAGADR